MRYYVEAYDKAGRQILGNLDGQRSWSGTNYKRTKWYKKLSGFKSLNNCVACYKIVHKTVSFEVVEMVYPAVQS